MLHLLPCLNNRWDKNANSREVPIAHTYRGKTNNKLRGLSPLARTIPTDFSGYLYPLSRGQRNESPTVVNFGFLDRRRYFL
jgi:hypothetical protein